MFALQEKCDLRPVRCLGLWEPAGWRLKVYGISYGRETPRPEAVEAAKRLAAAALPTPAVTPDRYGVGFLGVHDGRGACFVFLCWWANENELYHVVWSAPADDLSQFREHPNQGSRACVWDLAVMGHERQAWLDTVLRNPAGPDLAAYLARQLNGEA